MQNNIQAPIKTCDTFRCVYSYVQERI